MIISICVSVIINIIMIILLYSAPFLTMFSVEIHHGMNFDAEKILHIIWRGDFSSRLLLFHSAKILYPFCDFLRLNLIEPFIFNKFLQPAKLINQKISSFQSVSVWGKQSQSFLVLVQMKPQFVQIQHVFYVKKKTSWSKNRLKTLSGDSM